MGIIDSMLSGVANAVGAFSSVVPVTLGGSISNSLVLPPINQQEHQAVYFMLFPDGRFQGAPVQFTFPINPEDWNYSRPERVQVVQTIGVPFLDDFGTGVPTINIRGVTGWRTRLLTGMDGQSAFKFLRESIIDEYFNQRQLRVDLNQDPDQVRLVILNCVDKTAYDIVPSQTRLLRNKQRPLLYQYDLSFTVLEDLSNDPLCSALTIDPLGMALNWVTTLMGRIPILSGVLSFASTLASTASAGLQELCAVAGGFIGVCAGVGNLTRGVGAVSSLLYGVCSSVDTAFQMIKNSPNFSTLGLPSMISVNHISTTVHDLQCYYNKGAGSSFDMPDFGRIYGTSDGGGLFSGVAQSEGDLALTSAPPSGVEWAANLKDAVSSDNNNSDIIGFSGYTGAATPYTVNSSIGGLIDSMLMVAQNPLSPTDFSSAFQAIADVLNGISFDETAIDTTDEYSQSITQVNTIKTITTKQGDTLQRIALNELGDANRWRDIAVFNNLVVESVQTVWIPLSEFQIDSDVAPGTDYIDLGYDPPSSYVGARFTVSDTNGNTQSFIAASISGTQLNFSGFFSQYFTGPLSITQYVNRGRLGLFDSQTSLVSDSVSGSKSLSVAQAKDIYPDFILNVQNGDQSQTLTVKSVDYINQIVTVVESNTFSPAGSTVLIFDTESQLHHLEEGVRLNIPTAGNSGNSNTIQSDTELYGTDIQLDANGLLVIGSSGDMGDVSGLPNLEQAIRQRIACPYGSIDEHPDYGSGLETMVGQKGAPVFETAVQATVVDALTHDPRISAVSNVTTNIQGDSCQIQVKATSISSGTVEDISSSVPLS